jgi:APA family basic amino acid/polyamine antiporter
MEERRQLGALAATALVTGETIALGIFLTPASMAKSLGSPLLVALVWLGMALLALSGALCYSALAVRFPQTGGPYVYLREGFGPRFAFLYGWMSAAVLDPGLTASLAVGATAYVLALVALPAAAAPFVPAALLLAFALLNIVGTRISAAVMTTLNSVKILALLALVAWSLLGGHGSWTNLLPLAARRPGSEALFPALAGAAVGAFFSFGGWWDVGKLAGEIRQPERNLPRAMTFGVLLVTLVYLLVSFAFLYVVPIARVESNTAFVSQFGSVLFGAAGGRILSLAVLLSVLGGLLALTLSAPRVYYAMARDGAFFPAFGRLHPRFGTPVAAILLQTGIALALLALQGFDRILAYFIFPTLLLLALAATAVFRLRPRPHAWWFPAAPIVFVTGSVAVAFLILMHDPLPALLGLAIVLAGDPLRRWLGR